MKHLENKRLVVGRAGHDPATYGLKGRVFTIAAVVSNIRHLASFLPLFAIARSPWVNQPEVGALARVSG